ncbi:MAG: DUF1501 domain-containing protein [Leadbetterella sp.]|nr:DUF1501 domain-containing protein [Leadbetterella sp.]
MKRRDFVRNSLAGVLLPALINGLPFRAFGRVTGEDDEHILVIIQLNGGNDGLNTVIPLDQYSKYMTARGNITIPENKLLKILGNDTVGLHPAMTGLQSLFQEGKAALIQGVGYPNPNFSHFRATDIWNTASDATEVINSGWMGRYLAWQHPNYPNDPEVKDPLAIQIGSVVSNTLQGPLQSMGVAITNPSNFYNLVSGNTGPAPDTWAGKELDFLRKLADSTNLYAASIRAAASAVSQQAEYPAGNALADQLKIVAQLVAGGLKTRIYMVSLGGFDTHSNQVTTDITTGTHATLLGKVSNAIRAFTEDLKFLGISKKVLGFTYSEFGRRVKANASLGTDHGTAAPMFVFGDAVIPQVLGKSPELPSNPVNSDNLPMQYDFRSVYASVLQRWFCMDASYLDQVMLKDFQQLSIIKGEACTTVTANEPAQNALFSMYPNPCEHYFTVEFPVPEPGAHVLMQVFDNQGCLTDVPIRNNYTSGYHKLMVHAGGYFPGVYYVRLQVNERQEVKKLVKR